MTYKNDAEQLLAGSDELNRKRKKVEKVLGIIFGLLKKNQDRLPFGLPEDSRRVWSSVSDGKWNFEIVFTRTAFEPVLVISHDDENPNGYHCKSKAELPTKATPALYRNLDCFIKEVQGLEAIREDIDFLLSQASGTDGETE